MPSHDCSRGDEDKRLFPSRPESSHSNPEDLVDG
jgi:hypothetical protein